MGRTPRGERGKGWLVYQQVEFRYNTSMDNNQQLGTDILLFRGPVWCVCVCVCLWGGGGGLEDFENKFLQ